MTTNLIVGGACLLVGFIAGFVIHVIFGSSDGKKKDWVELTDDELKARMRGGKPPAE